MVTLTFKTTKAEAERLRREAHARRMTFSSYMRSVTQPAATPRKKRKDIITPGRVILDTPPITDEDLAKTLYEY